MKKGLWDLESNRFKLKEWEKTRIEYWQPVLYFTGANRQQIDFNICAKNACTTIKTYLGYTVDRDWLSHNRICGIELEELKQDPSLSKSDLEKVISGEIPITHWRSRRKNRLALWLNGDDDVGMDFFRYETPKIAIRRDPVKRFISAYYQIHSDNAWAYFKSHKYNVDEMLDHLENKTFWNEHLQSQSWWHGNKSAEEFDYVFHINDTHKCMQHMHQMMGWKSEVPPIHMMKTTKLDPPELTWQQKGRIEELYKEDYYNGWY